MTFEECNTMRNNFISEFWNYYLILESDCVNLRRYIAFRTENLQVCSDEIIRQFVSTSAEFDTVSRKITGTTSNRATISNYARWFLDPSNIDDIRDVKISIRSTGLVLKPFESWSNSRPGQLFWWKSYNKVKHDRYSNYADGSLSNLLNALGALYFIESFEFRRIAQPFVDDEEKPVVDVPTCRSQLFDLNNFVTNFNVFGPELYGKVSD